LNPSKTLARHYKYPLRKSEKKGEKDGENIDKGTLCVNI
jgi:hypothetical protein